MCFEEVSVNIQIVNSLCFFGPRLQCRDLQRRRPGAAVVLPVERPLQMIAGVVGDQLVVNELQNFGFPISGTGSALTLTVNFLDNAPFIAILSGANGTSLLLVPSTAVDKAKITSQGKNSDWNVRDVNPGLVCTSYRRCVFSVFS